MTPIQIFRPDSLERCWRLIRKAGAHTCSRARLCRRMAICLALTQLCSGCFSILSEQPIAPPGPVDERLLGSWIEETSHGGPWFVFIRRLDGPWLEVSAWQYPMANLASVGTHRGFINILGGQRFGNILVERPERGYGGGLYVLLAYDLDTEGKWHVCDLGGPKGVIETAVKSGSLASDKSWEVELFENGVRLTDSSEHIAKYLMSTDLDELCRTSGFLRRFE